MKIRLLGTGASEGFPAMFCTCEKCMQARMKGGPNIRTRSGALIDEDLKVDFPPDTMSHVHRYGLRMDRVRHLLITHSHADHFDPHDLYPRRTPVYAVMPPDTPPTGLYGNEKVLGMVHPEDLTPDAEGRVAWELHQVQHDVPIDMGDYRVTPVRALHDPREECMIYVIEKGGKTLLYGHDTGWFDEVIWDVLRRFRFDCVIMDCTYGLMSQTRGHLGFPENIRLRETMLREGMADERTVFVATHYSHNCLADYDEMVQAAQGTGILISYDGMVIEV